MAQMKAIVDKLLTNVSNGYFPQGYICEQVLPMVAVKQKSGKLGKYGTSHLRIETTIAGGRGEYRRVESITRSTDSYQIDSHGLEDVVTPDDYDNVEEPFQAEEDTTAGLTNLIYLRKEKGLADTLTSTSIITQNTTLSGTSQFSDYLNSDPLTYFNTAKEAIYDGCGEVSNFAIMEWKVFNKVRFHPALLRSLGFADNRPNGLTALELASIMEVDRLLIPKVKYESANEGQTSSFASVWGKHIIFGVAPSTAQKRQVSLGYRLQLSRNAPRKVYKYPINNPPESKGILVEDHYDHFITNPLAAYLIKDAIA